eukprot:Nk52_evm3s2340 gene=Nk52_evmTU3s2340
MKLASVIIAIVLLFALLSSSTNALPSNGEVKVANHGCAANEHFHDGKCKECLVNADCAAGDEDSGLIFKKKGLKGRVGGRGIMFGVSKSKQGKRRLNQRRRISTDEEESGGESVFRSDSHAVSAGRGGEEEKVESAVAVEKKMGSGSEDEESVFDSKRFKSKTAKKKHKGIRFGGLSTSEGGDKDRQGKSKGKRGVGSLVGIGEEDDEEEVEEEEFQFVKRSAVDPQLQKAPSGFSSAGGNTEGVKEKGQNVGGTGGQYSREALKQLERDSGAVYFRAGGGGISAIAAARNGARDEDGDVIMTVGEEEEETVPAGGGGAEEFIPLSEYGHGMGKGRSKGMGGRQSQKLKGGNRKGGRMQLEQMGGENHSGEGSESDEDFEALERNVMRAAGVKKDIVRDAFKGVRHHQHVIQEHTLPELVVQIPGACGGLNGMIKRLKEELVRAQSVCEEKKVDVENAESEKAETERELAVLEGDLEYVKKRHKFFDGLQVYVSQLLHCLKGKSKQISALEKEWNGKCERYAEDNIESVSGMKSLLEKFDRTEHAIRFELEQSEGSDERTDLTIKSHIRTLWEDTVEDFRSLEVIKSRFELWKLTYLTSYKDSYISMTLPKLFSPFARWACLLWNPLEKNCENVMDMDWFSILAGFGFVLNEDTGEYEPIDQSEASNNSEEVDFTSDLNLVPNVVEAVVVPRLQFVVGHLWNPFDIEESQNVVKVCESLHELPTVSSSRESTKQIYAAIRNRLELILKKFCYILKTPFSTDIKRNGLAFVKKLCETLPALIESTCMWREILPTGFLDAVLATLMDDYLCPYLVYLDTHCKEEQEVAKQPQIPTLADFMCRIMCQTGHILNTKGYGARRYGGKVGKFVTEFAWNQGSLGTSTAADISTKLKEVWEE